MAHTDTRANDEDQERQTITRPLESGAGQAASSSNQLSGPSQPPLLLPVPSYDEQIDPARRVASASTVHAFEAPSHQNYHQPLPQAQPIGQVFNSQLPLTSPDHTFGSSIFKQTALSPNDEPSHGTLVISASGRSKYLGPSAASEWLKDVRTFRTGDKNTC